MIAYNYRMILLYTVYAFSITLAGHVSILAKNYTEHCKNCHLQDDHHTIDCVCTYNKEQYIGKSGGNCQWAYTLVDQHTTLNLNDNIGEVGGKLTPGNSNFSQSKFLKDCQLNNTILKCNTYQTSQDLNLHVGYDQNTHQLIWQEGGNYTSLCKECTVTNGWLKCNCPGNPQAALLLDQKIGETRGRLIFNDKNFSKSSHLTGCNVTSDNHTLICVTDTVMGSPVETSVDLNQYISGDYGRIEFD